MQLSLYRASVLPVGGSLADRIRYVPAPQHLQCLPCTRDGSAAPVLATLCCEGGPDGMDLREVDGDGEDGKG